MVCDVLTEFSATLPFDSCRTILVDYRDLYKQSTSRVSIIPVPKLKWIDAVVTQWVGSSGIIEGVAEG